MKRKVDGPACLTWAACRAPDLGITVISTRDLSTRLHFQMRQLFLSTALRSTEQKNCWDGCSGRRRASSHLCYLEISAAFALFNHSGVEIEDEASLSIFFF